MRRYYSKMTRKGQVTVPADVRREMKVKVGDQVAFVVHDGEVKLEPPGSWTAKTYGFARRPGARTLSERELKEAAEQAISDDVVERGRRAKR